MMTTIAFIGSSTVRSRAHIFNWIQELNSRPENRGCRFLNFGRDGDLVWNANKRLSKVIRADPDKVVILAGNNDVLTRVFWKAKMVLVSARRSPSTPSTDWFMENVQCMVDELKAKTHAEIALVSLQPIGEAPYASHPKQQQLNGLIKQYNEIIQTIAKQNDLAYIPLYEELNLRFTASSCHELTRFSFRSFYRDALRYYVLHQSGDEIAKKHGWTYHVDGIHLNRTGGMVLADLVQEFIKK